MRVTFKTEHSSLAMMRQANKLTYHIKRQREELEKTLKKIQKAKNGGNIGKPKNKTSTTLKE